MEAGGLRVLECKIQGCSVKVEGGGGRRAIKWAAPQHQVVRREGVDEFSHQKHPELVDFEGRKDGQYRNVGE